MAEARQSAKAGTRNLNREIVTPTNAVSFFSAHSEGQGRDRTNMQSFLCSKQESFLFTKHIEESF